ncbi:hypothetical protein GYMLUDRAFT_985142 [Collybiopsis luxurians FD-317 M1]|uniref:Uncharacterized protein n=1 Tax=Collybiopsis luxurians FD-317 M1 TaxID=944289 RepID=A0A0D0D486_9AGAR|nr:hypothetical protein GYMLUDRAFT_985142 [Collybiopsis luxurians FD-317 M1]
MANEVDYRTMQPEVGRRVAEVITRLLVSLQWIRGPQSAVNSGQVSQAASLFRSLPTDGHPMYLLEAGRDGGTHLDALVPSRTGFGLFQLQLPSARSHPLIIFTWFPETNLDAQSPDGSCDLNENVNVRRDARTPRFGGGLPLSKDLKTIVVIGYESYDTQQLDLNCARGLNECDTRAIVIGRGSALTTLHLPYLPFKIFASSFAMISTDITWNDLTGGPAVVKGKVLALVLANAMSDELGFYQIADGHGEDSNDPNLWFEGGSLIEDVVAVLTRSL